MNTQTAPEGLNKRSSTCVRKRTLTEDRRRQNREAQRRYRERRKAVRNPTQHDNNVITGLFDADVEQIPCHLGFPDCSLQPIDDSIFVEPMFLSDMLMLNTSPDDIGRVDPLPDAQEHNEPSPSNGTTTLSLPCSPRSIQPPNPDHTPSLPSLYKNHLTIRKLSFYAARIQNALHLGLPTFLAQKDNDISPWYWHTQFSLLITSSSTSPTNPSRSAPATFSNYGFAPTRPVRCQPCFTMSASVSPDLSPTPLQRSHAHGMYLDVVPFPVFRDRAITLLAMQPPAFEEAELKRDMEDGGLVVWGAGHGKAGGALVRDRRNWECAGWFWRKWRLLVEGSGLEEQSRWWRDMRGEEDEFGEL